MRNQTDRSQSAPARRGDRTRLALVRAVDAAPRLFVKMLQRLLFRRLHLPSLRRILIFRIGNVGDIAAAVPALEAIRRRFPEAQITLLTSPGREGAPGARELIPAGSIVDSLIVYHTCDIATWRGRVALARRLRTQGFDLFIELSNILAPLRQVLQSIALAKAAGCRFGLGFQVASTRLFSRAQALHIPFPNEADRLLQSLQDPLDLPRNASGRLTVTGDDREAVMRSLEGAGIARGERFLVVHAGAKRPANRWMEDRFARVADEVQGRYGIRVVLTGGAPERELVERIRNMMRTRPAVLCGELSLLQIAALLEEACLYIGNDTGPMHLAAAMGTPAVAIFSARDLPGQWHPFGSGHVVLRKDVPCSPCFLDVCDRGLPCLERIEVDEVLRAVERQLSRIGIRQAVLE